ncbi:MAG: hypothetical protein K6B46_02120 [Opitutales bacterium]|nr:hypothetical protein [Opitutales bacterium]
MTEYPDDVEIAPGLLSGDLDAKFALKIFSRKTVDEVVEYLQKEAPNPYDIFEHFYFMSNRAFLFYFPIFEKYLRAEQESYGEIDDVFVLAVLRLLKDRGNVLAGTDIGALISNLHRAILELMSSKDSNSTVIQEIKKLWIEASYLGLEDRGK